MVKFERKHVLTMALAILFVVPMVAIAQDQMTIIPSQGTIAYKSVPLTVILRSINVQDGVPSNINAWVDNWFANHTYATAVTLSDMHQYGIWWYGYSFGKTSGTWMGWTFSQLKALMDRLHYHGLKVGLETTGIAWNTDGQEYNYIKNQHLELAFTDANGIRADGNNNAANHEKNPGTNRVIPDFFANFTTTDIANSIPVGTRLIDLYTTRLTQMILDGLQWDFWFGTDGWNGFNIQGYSWDTSTKSSCYSFSRQEENEWGNWSGANLPANWSTMNYTQRANAITQTSSILNNWWQYWQIRFAKMYAQIRQAFINAGRLGPFYLVGTVDVSSSPTGGGNLSPYGMWNVTLLTKYNAVDYYYVDQESTAYVGATYGIAREEAYVGALAKMQSANAKPIIGLQPVDWLDIKYPLWEVKQSYLAQAVNYVWYNGKQYRVSDPSTIMMQYPNGGGWKGWSQQDVTELFSWIQAMANILENAQPLWLGPVYPIPNTISGALGMAWWSINFTFAQWAWSANLQNNPQFINQSMGTFLMDEALGDSGPQLTGDYDKMVNQLWGTNRLNLWYYEARGQDWRIDKVWGANANQAENNFHITYSQGSSSNYTVLGGLAGVAGWIASGYGGTNYVIGTPSNQYDYHGIYLPKSGFASIASFTYDSPNRIAAGYYTNSSVGRFLITHMPNEGKPLPKSMLNKMLYWASNCPVNSSEPLLDMTIMNRSGKIMIPMSNQKNVGSVAGNSAGWSLSSTLNINAQQLGLGSISNYKFYWAYSSDTMTFSSWNNVAITLNGMADILIIEPRI